MAEPKSESGQKYVAKTEKLEGNLETLGRDLLVETTRLTTHLDNLTKLLAGGAALLIGVAGYFFINVSTLQSNVEGLKTSVSDLKESAKVIHSAGATLSDDRETLQKMKQSLDAFLQRFPKHTASFASKFAVQDAVTTVTFRNC